jgi:hypothetical protein
MRYAHETHLRHYARGKDTTITYFCYRSEGIHPGPRHSSQSRRQPPYGDLLERGLATSLSDFSGSSPRPARKISSVARGVSRIAVQSPCSTPTRPKVLSSAPPNEIALTIESGSRV